MSKKIYVKFVSSFREIRFPSVYGSFICTCRSLRCRHYLFPFDGLGFQSIILQQAGEFDPQFRQVRVQCCFTSTETVRTIRDQSPGWPPRLSHSSLALRYRTCHPYFNVRVRNSGPPCLAATPVHHCIFLADHTRGSASAWSVKLSAWHM